MGRSGSLVQIRAARTFGRAKFLGRSDHLTWLEKSLRIQGILPQGEASQAVQTPTIALHFQLFDRLSLRFGEGHGSSIVGLGSRCVPQGIAIGRNVSERAVACPKVGPWGRYEYWAEGRPAAFCQERP
jgi:hypothetical protein